MVTNQGDRPFPPNAFLAREKAVRTALNPHRSLYEAVEGQPGMYRRKAATSVQVWRVPNDTSDKAATLPDLPPGSFKALPGDYIVQFPDGHRQVITAFIFPLIYEAIF